MKKLSIPVATIAFTLLLVACNTGDKKADKPFALAQEAVQYAADSVIMNGYVAYNAALEDKRPVVLIVHEWWGLGDYEKNRANQLAELGYLAMAVDMYGNGEIAQNPTDAGALALPFYMNPEMARLRFEAALKSIKSNPLADTGRIAAIGYCFGGAQVLNMARLGVPLTGVVSFHGNLQGVPLRKDLLQADVLICHGSADEMVPQTEVAQFKQEMDSVGASYEFKAYPGATHAFTNPKATEKGAQFNLGIAYHAAADSASWNDMKAFFKKIF